MVLSDTETYELRRVLAAFKAELPSHRLGYWYIASHPVETIVEDDAPPDQVRWHPSPYERVRIRGHAECVRCRKRFEIPSIGNFTTIQESVETTILTAKEWVERRAERDGPCWGDVPQPPDDPTSLATLDGVSPSRVPCEEVRK